jgi:hypothetical protein
MSLARALGNGLAIAVGAGAVTAGAWWLTTRPGSLAGKAAGPAAPAVVANPLKEDQINTVTLSPEAVERLALRTGLIERKPVGRVRVYGGEVIVPTGETILVAAPVSGTVKAPPGGVPRPGQAVMVGQPVFLLQPLLTPEGQVNLTNARIEAEGQV